MIEKKCTQTENRETIPLHLMSFLFSIVYNEHSLKSTIDQCSNVIILY